MGRRGPPKKPAELIHGWRKDEREKSTLKPPLLDKPPRAPSWLNKDGQREWRIISKQLHRLGILTEVDLTALAIYCQAWADYRDAQAHLAIDGKTLVRRDLNGNVKSVQASPYWAIARQATEVILKFLREFGLTPSARVDLRPTASRDVGTSNAGRKQKADILQLG